MPNTLNIEVRQVEPVTVVALTGELNAQTAPLAADSLRDRLTPQCHILFDLHAVTFLSSAGLRFLASVERAVGDKGGRVVLAGVAEEVRNIMEITGFWALFAHCDSVDAGLALLSS